MAEVLWIGGKNSAITLGNFSVLGGSNINSVFSTESKCARTVRVAGTHSRYGVSIDANGTARTINMRKNSANANGSIAPTNSTAGQFYDNVNTDHYTTSDTRDWQENGTAPAYIPFALKSVFVADQGHVGIAGTGGFGWANGTNFTGFGAPATGTPESIFQQPMRSAGQIQNFCLYVTTANTVASSVTVRKNTANGNSTISVNASTTGIFEDNTHTDAFVSGDKITLSATATAAGGVYIAEALLSYNNLQSEQWAGFNAAFSASGYFIPISSICTTPPTTEASAQIAHGFSVRTSNFRCVVISNSMTAPTQHKVRKNGVNGNQGFAVAASTTGTFEDTTHTDDFGPTDNINYNQTLGTSGSINPVYMLTETIAQVYRPQFKTSLRR